MFKIQGTTSWWKHGCFFRHSKTKGFLTLLCICMICVYTNIFTNLPACRNSSMTTNSTGISPKLSLTFTWFNLFLSLLFLADIIFLKKKIPATSLPLGHHPGARCSQKIAFPLELAVNQGHVAAPMGSQLGPCRIQLPLETRRFRQRWQSRVAVGWKMRFFEGPYVIM